MATVTSLAFKDVKTVMTKSSLPVGGYSVNPYVGCPHACRYCYASFMKRFTGHTEKWGTFLDVKNWPRISDPHKYDGQRIVIGSVTDGYNEHEATYKRTRMLLEQLRGSSAEGSEGHRPAEDFPESHGLVVRQHPGRKLQG